MSDIFVTELRTENFRNLSSVVFTPTPNINMIIGKNAQGKTNLVEALWLMSGCKSFRGSKERECVAVGQHNAIIKMKFQDSQRVQEICFRFSRNSKEREIFLNGVQYKGNRKLFEEFRCIAFLPSDISLSEGVPEKRRSFLDMCCSQIKPSFMDIIKRYSLILSHRSMILKKNPDKVQLTVWNEQLASEGCKLAVMRNRYISEIAPAVKKLYSDITSGSEILDISYKSAVFPETFQYPSEVTEKMKSIYLKRLEESIDDDIRLGYTQCGVHRDDLEMKINGLSVKNYGSQGQKKSSALVLKLAQAQLLENKIKEPPVIILDDVMGELDSSRQKLVSEITKGMQVFITTCNADSVILDDNCSLYKMENGILM